MSSDFELTSIRVLLDGRLLYSASGISAKEAAQVYTGPLYAGPVPSGDHAISVELSYRGVGDATLFKFVVRSSHAFRAIEGRTASIAFNAIEKPDVPYWRRPSVEWRDSTSDGKVAREDWQPNGSYPCAISFSNRMAKDFRLVGVSFTLDGKRLYFQPEDVSVGSGSEDVTFYNGPVPLGKHGVSARVSYEGLGNGNLKGFLFSAKSDHTFTAVDGKATKLQLIVLDRAPHGEPSEARPYLEWNEQVMSAAAIGATR